ncbi:MAG: hypothetical protein IBJ17_07545 [Reyranella sp.]|jgi:hypothetical protein|nr:hypothetical protein [Reyranella sp.]
MIKKAILAPRNSQIVICDPGHEVEVPRWKRNANHASTDTCILMGCLMDADGPTHFKLGEIDEVDPGRPPAFQGELKTPTRKIALESVDGHTVLDAPVPHERTMIRVWTNHEREPDEVIVGFE